MSNGTTAPAVIVFTDDQLRSLAGLVADQLARRSVAGRVAFTVSEAAEATGFSKDHLYREIRAKRLPSVHPGGGCEMRVLPDHLRMWALGQTQHGDMPVMGVDPVVAARNSKKRRGK